MFISLGTCAVLFQRRPYPTPILAISFSVAAAATSRDACAVSSEGQRWGYLVTFCKKRVATRTVWKNGSDKGKLDRP